MRGCVRRRRAPDSPMPASNERNMNRTAFAPPRFFEAQENVYSSIVEELSSGLKRSPEWGSHFRSLQHWVAVPRPASTGSRAQRMPGRSVGTQSSGGGCRNAARAFSLRKRARPDPGFTGRSQAPLMHGTVQGRCTRRGNVWGGPAALLQRRSGQVDIGPAAIHGLTCCAHPSAPRCRAMSHCTSTNESPRPPCCTFNS